MTHSHIYISIDEWIELINKHNIKPEVIMEIGSMNGVDAYRLSTYYDTLDVTIIEAHPVFAENIKINYPYFNVYNFAASDNNGHILFNAVLQDSENLGMSSMLDRNEQAYPSHCVTGYEQIEVNSFRMDYFCQTANIESIDILKIDVEGNTYEVLEGFGDMLWFVKCLHIECEHEEVWKGQKLYADVEKLLISKGFIPIAIKIGFPQSDSVWVKKEFYNPNWAS